MTYGQYTHTHTHTHTHNHSQTFPLRLQSLRVGGDIRSHDGADSEPDWSVSLGLQNIRRKGLQEGDNGIQGNHERALCSYGQRPPGYCLGTSSRVLPCQLHFLSLRLNCLCLCLVAYLFPWRLYPVTLDLKSTLYQEETSDYCWRLGWCQTIVCVLKEVCVCAHISCLIFSWFFSKPVVKEEEGETES